MSLVDDIRGLQERALTDLAAAHDYYMDTKMAWRIVQKFVKAGYKINMNNSIAWTVTTEAGIAVSSRNMGVDSQGH